MTGRSDTIRALARQSPSKIRGDHQVDRVLWAISERSGAPAKDFAGLDNPPAPIAWLPIFADNRYQSSDLPRFGIEPSRRDTKPNPFSILHRPTPYLLAPSMTVFEHGKTDLQLDSVMFALACWLLKHLEAPELLSWIVKNGGGLHPTFRSLIRAEIERKPLSPPLQTIWSILSSDLVDSSPGSQVGLYHFADHARSFGWTAVVRHEFLELFKPLVSFREPFSSLVREELGDADSGPKRVRHYLNGEVTLPAGSRPETALQGIAQTPGYRQALADMLPDFTGHLRKAMELKALLEDATGTSDLSYLDRPSISDHSQNQEFHDWTTLITLCRDAWVEVDAAGGAGALNEVERWKQIGFPLFRRLAFFAAAHSSTFTDAQRIELLLGDNVWWLWSVETQREVFRLIARLAPQATATNSDAFYRAILAGPPREMFRDDLEPGSWDFLVAHTVWLRLAKLRQGGALLSEAASQRLQNLEQEHQDWKLEAGERDEFPSWMGSSGSLDGMRWTGPVVELPTP